MDNNVVDCVVGAGAPGASLGLGVKPRRVGVDTWAKPVADPKLLAYLGGTGTQPVPQPCPDPARHQKPDCPDTSRHSKPDCPDPSLHQKAYPGDGTFLEVGAILESDYKAAGRPGLDAGSGVWFGRVVWDHLAGKLTMAESVAKHRPEWRAALGLP
jgi:hypothetical protein